MTTQEIANQLVKMCREGKFEAAYKELFAQNAKSIEPVGENAIIEGLDKLLAKGEGWAKMTEVHSCTLADPIVAGNYFSTNFVLDSTNKQTGQRTQMEEIAVYKVQDGKVVSEQFFYDWEG